MERSIPASAKTKGVDEDEEDEEDFSSTVDVRSAKKDKAKQSKSSALPIDDDLDDEETREVGTMHSSEKLRS